MFREVAPDCLHWCAGYKIQKMDYCLVSSARDIMSCFKEGNKFLPAPPARVHVSTVFSNSHILIEWEDSIKNKDSTHWYWVYWKKVGTNEMDRERVETNQYELASLQPDATYEFVVKTSNYHGTSVLSEPLVINLSHIQAEYFTSETQLASNVFFISLFLFTFAVFIAFVAYLTYKNNYLSKFRQSGSCNNIGVSFENHAYNVEDTIQMQDTSSNSVTANGNGFDNNDRSPFHSDKNNNPNGGANEPSRVEIRLS